MIERQDFVKFYMEHKGKDGFLSSTKFHENFETYNDNRFQGLSLFHDKTGSRFFIKTVRRHGGVDAEVLLSRIYERLGFIAPRYYPMKNDLREYVVSKDISGDDVKIAGKFGNIFLSNGTTFPTKNTDTLSGRYTPETVTDLIKLRMLDTATFNTDRHTENFFYRAEKNDNGIYVANKIGTIDFESSGNSGSIGSNIRRYWTFYNNFVPSGDTDVDNNLTRDRMIELYKENETVQQFLPTCELAEILGSVDFNKEADEIKQETNYQVDGHLVDMWAKSFDQMAEELEQ